ncbi:hypothetical protein DPMN_128536 [Dreissena polymorpha]|uniref:Uncharacterized protein n=1 Tax=Dreissena polymorpha TaxID=45954 RepID=A0A9D4JZS3_DREPO|nr:hypothetical protein DPMN_128536 [Dreissena polymorpha]
MAVEGNAGLEINVRKKGDVSDPNRVLTMGRQQRLRAATGKEESGADDSVMFVNCPFKFDLSRSKTTYRKGFAYNMQLRCEWQAASSRLSHNQLVDRSAAWLKFWIWTRLLISQEIICSRVPARSHIPNGRGLRVMRDLKLNALSVRSFAGKTGPYTGDIERLEQDVMDKVSPVGRVFAFYVHNNQLVADSSIFHVDAKCREQRLDMFPAAVQMLPAADRMLPAADRMLPAADRSLVSKIDIKWTSAF